MTDQVKQVALSLSEQIPVEWDRYTEYNQFYNIYGWIERKDLKRDFVLLLVYIREGIHCSYVTSSAKYSKRINEILNGPESDHVDCIKFETDTVPTDAEGEE